MSSESFTDQLFDRNLSFKAFNNPENYEFSLVKSCQKSPTTFQAVIKISESFRSHIRKCNDRVIISFFMCKVYDQIDVRRCNKCQHFGHWFNECDKQVACSICSESHESKSCPNYKNNAFVNHKCINCSRNGLLPFNHKADSSTCPVYVTELNRCKAIFLSAIN